MVRISVDPATGDYTQHYFFDSRGVTRVYAR